ncbi:MAG: hypothetical protein ABJP66_00540 [Hyphomicrobiales bacterium]
MQFKSRSILAKVTCLSICLSLAPPPVQPLADAGLTAAISSAALDLGIEYLKSDPGNPPVTIALANRELLKKLHSRLDLIEAGITEALVKLDQLPNEFYIAAVEAQGYQLNQEITSIGLEVMDLTIAHETDLFKLRSNINARDVLSGFYRANLIDNIRDVSLTSRNFSLRPNSKNSGALTVVLSSYIELSTRIELHRRFGGSESAISLASTRYLEKFQEILDPKNPNSLSSLITNLASQIMERPKAKGWVPEFDDQDLPLLSSELQFRTKCTLHEESFDSNDPEFLKANGASEDKQRMIWHAPHAQNNFTLMFVQESEIETIPLLKPIFFSETVRLLKNSPGTSITGLDNINDCEILRPKFVHEIDHLCGGYSCYYDLHRKPYIGKKNIDEFLKRHQINLEQIELELELLAQLVAIKNAVKLAETRVEAVSKGDFSNLEIGFFIDVERMGPLEAARLARKADLYERLAKTNDYAALLARNRVEIEKMISSQDDEIREAFETAQKAAKTNRMLSLLKAGAVIAHQYYIANPEPSGAEAENLTEATVATLAALAQDSDRSPASGQVESRLNNVLENLSWWGGLVSAKREKARMLEARSKLEAAFPLNEVRKYDIYTHNNRFHRFYLSDKPHLLPTGVVFRGSIEITGKGQN